MRINKIFIALSIIFFSCSKNENNSTNNVPEDIDAKLRGKWYLTSETRSGSCENSTYKGLPSDYIEYRADRKAYSRIQGQYGSSYDYELNIANKTVLFHYITTNPMFMITQPCRTGSGCLRVAQLKFISDNLLVLGNTFRDTTNGVISTLTITDSLAR